MPRYELTMKISEIIEAGNEDDAIEEFLAKFPVHEHLVVTELEPPICGQCSGSGEGMHDGTRCLHCKGTGSEPEGEDDEDYDDEE